MISPIAKFALAIADALDAAITEIGEELSESTRQSVCEARIALDRAITEFKATGGAE